MLGFGKTMRHREIIALELQAMLADSTVTLVDVREPGEFALQHMHGAINRPLSRFDPAALAPSPGKAVVLQCAGGKRSGMALDRCIKANSVIDSHLGGGLDAWKAAGLPTVR